MTREYVFVLGLLLGVLVLLSFLSASSETMTALVRIIYRATGTSPTAPLYGSYSAENLVSLTDYTKASTPEVTLDELETMRMISQLGLRRTMEHVANDPAYEGSEQESMCHGAAHVVGSAAFDLLGIEALEQCTTGCFSGCYHGALQRMGVRNRPDASTLMEELKTLCGNRATAFEREQCFHGAGHGILLQERYELNSALSKCRDIGAEDDMHPCYRGVFMEFYGGDGNAERMKKEELHFPCNLFDADELIQDACYRLQATYFLKVYDNDFAQASDECLRAPSSMQSTCFARLGQLSGADTKNPPGNTEAFCATIPSKYYDNCIRGGLRQEMNFYGIDPEGRAGSFCKALANPEGKRVCYEQYMSDLRSLFLEQEPRLFICSLFEPPYDELCKTKQQ